MKTRLRLMPPALAAAALLVAGTGCVSYGQPRYGYHAPSYSDARGVAYDNGYRRGIDRGVADARSGRHADYRDDRDYRDADRGYSQRYGSRGDYRQAFRRGYENGYREGYERVFRGSGYGSGGRAVPREGRYRDSRGGGYGYVSPAYDKGHRDGYEKGREDGRDGDRYDPLRHKWYREGDRDYNSRYGSREQYKMAYRDAFKQGYEQGYRDGQYRR